MPFPPQAPKGATPLKNKGSKTEMLPSRHARAQLTGGDPINRTMNGYAKATPGPRDQSATIATNLNGPMSFGS